MKQKINIVLLLLMTMCMGAWADDGDVASVLSDGVVTNFADFNEAWAYANKAGMESTITVLKNVTVTEPLKPVSGAKITLDATSDEVNIIANTGNKVHSKGSLFVIDAEKSSDYDDGLIINGGCYMASSADLVTPYTTVGSADVVYVGSNFPVTINGGVFQAMSKDRYGLYVFSKEPDVTINGGTFVYSVTAAEGGVCGGIAIGYGNTAIADLLGKRKAFRPKGDKEPVNISTLYTVELLKSVSVVDCPHNKVSGIAGRCAYCDDAINYVVSVNGGYVFETLSEAVDYAMAATEEDTLTLNREIPLDNETWITVTKNMTIDMNGHDITGVVIPDLDSESIHAGVINVNGDGATLTIKDSSTDTPGVITNINPKGTAVSVIAGNVKTEGYTLSSLGTLDSYVMTSDLSVESLKVYKGTTTVNGGTITKNITVSDGCTFNVTSGTFAFDPTPYGVAETCSVVKDEETGTWTVTADAYKVQLTMDGNTVKYASMYDALNAINQDPSAEGTITMLADETSDPDLTYTVDCKALTFEGGEHTWTLPAMLTINSQRHLKFNSGTLKLTNQNTSDGQHAINQIGWLTVNGGTIDASESAHNAIDVVGNVAETFINGGTIIGNKKAIYFDEFYKIALKGGTFKPGSDYAAIDMQDNTNQLRLCDVLARGYDFFSTADGAAVSAGGEILDNGIEVKVKRLETFTDGKIIYKATSTDASTSLTAAVKGYDGDMPESSRISFLETYTDPYNECNVFTVDSVLENAFYNQANLVDVEFSDNIHGIGRNAFYGTGLENLIIPQYVEWIDKTAFNDCKSLGTISYLAENVRNTDYYNQYYCPFYGSDENVTIVLIGKDVKSIPDYMFSMLGKSSTSPSNLVICYAETAPTIGASTWSEWAKANFTLSTPNSTDKAFRAWGFNKYSSIDSELEISDEYPELFNGTYGVGKLSYTRADAEGNSYDTFCLPFDISWDTSLFQNVWIPSTVALIQDDQLCILFKKEKTNTIAANTPFIVKYAATGDLKLVNSKLISLTGPFTDPEAKTIKVFDYTGKAGNMYQNKDYDVTYCGTIKGVTNHIYKGYMQFNSDGTVQQAESDIPAFHAYLTKVAATASAKEMPVLAVLEGDDDIPTAISEIENAALKVENGSVYTLDGKCVSVKAQNLPKGLYIVNGKKIIK